MATDPRFDSEPSYCGNCGTPLASESSVCGNCGRTVQPAPDTTAVQGPSPGPAPADFIPYCRSCGVGVPWGQAHTCSRCGVSPLCALHFRTHRKASATTASKDPALPLTATASVAWPALCTACGASGLRQLTEFCPDCGRSVAMAQNTGEWSTWGSGVRAGCLRG